MFLYEISDDLQQLYTMLEEDPENEAIQETINLIMYELTDKIDGYYAVIRQLEADAEAIKQEKLRLARKQSAADNGAKRLRDAIKYAMLVTNERKIKTARCTVSLSTRSKAILDVDPENIPEKFQKKTIEPRMADIEKWLKLEGDCDWAHMEQVESLTIR